MHGRPLVALFSKSLIAVPSLPFLERVWSLSLDDSIFQGEDFLVTFTGDKEVDKQQIPFLLPALEMCIRPCSR